MRIVAGRFHGTNLESPKGTKVRPTAARVREALFSILGGDFSGVVVADLFAGAGGLGLEALSRGAEFAIFVESDPKALTVLRKNIDRLGCSDMTYVYPCKVEALSGEELEDVNVVFLDPPYHQQPNLPDLGRFLNVSENIRVIVYQHPLDDLRAYPKPAKGEFSPWRPGWLPERFHTVDQRRYGKTVLTFFAREGEE